MTHTVTQDEIIAGSLTNTATATSDQDSAQDDQTVTLVHNPFIALDKLIDGVQGPITLTNPSSGDTVAYSYTVTNDGNVPLTDVTLNDDVEGTIALTGLTDEDADTFADDLAPGAAATGSVTHSLTQAEIDAGSLTNNAAVIGSPPVGADETAEDDATATLTRNPDVTISKTPDIGDTGQPLSVATGDIVVFTYTVTNPGNVSLENVVVSDNQPEVVTFVGGDTDGDTELDPTETWTYTADHTVTQADLDAGVIGTATDGDPGTGKADANGVGGSGSVSATDPGGVTLDRNPAISVDKLVNGLDAVTLATPSSGDPVSYSYTVTNDGNVSLSNVVLNDDVEGGITLSVTSLAPGASATGSTSWARG